MNEPYSVLGLKKGATEEEVRHAYRQLARRWHPDRFPAGPERMWAEDKMAEINEAHRAIMSGEAGRLASTPAGDANEAQQLKDIEKLMEMGQNAAARAALMRMECRSAQWNYLFGAVLMRMGDYEKSVLYFGIATRQRPENAQYRAAFASAEAVRDSHRAPSLYKRLFGKVAVR